MSEDKKGMRLGFILVKGILKSVRKGKSLFFTTTELIKKLFRFGVKEAGNVSLPEISLNKSGNKGVVVKVPAPKIDPVDKNYKEKATKKLAQEIGNIENKNDSLVILDLKDYQSVFE